MGLLPEAALVMVARSTLLGLLLIGAVAFSSAAIDDLDDEVPEEPPASYELTPENWDELIGDSDEYWMVEFFAPWCGHCKKLAPEWEKAAKQLAGVVKLGALDADEHKDFA